MRSRQDAVEPCSIGAGSATTQPNNRRFEAGGHNMHHATGRNSGGGPTAAHAMPVRLEIGIFILVLAALASPAAAQGAIGLDAWCSWPPLISPPDTFAIGDTCAGSATPIQAWSTCEVRRCAPCPFSGEGLERCRDLCATGQMHVGMRLVC